MTCRVKNKDKKSAAFASEGIFVVGPVGEVNGCTLDFDHHSNDLRHRTHFHSINQINHLYFNKTEETLILLSETSLLDSK